MTDALEPFERAAIGANNFNMDDSNPVVFTPSEVNALVAEHKGLRITINLLREDARKLEPLLDYLKYMVKLQNQEGYEEEELEEAGKKCNLLILAVNKYFEKPALLILKGEGEDDD